MAGETHPIEWSSADFLRNGEAVMRALAEYHDTLRGRPVASFEGVDSLAASLSERPPPELPEDFDEILADTLSEVVPNLVHWNHPRFHGYFSISGSYPGALADLLAAGLNVNAMLRSAAPAAGLVETLVLRWIREMVGYHPEATGVLVPGASLGTFYALVAARDRLVPEIGEWGYSAKAAGVLRIYVSEQTHSSIDKAASALGVGSANVVRIGTDDGYAMSVPALEAAIESDARRGAKPLAVVATIGTTATGAIDPVVAIAEVCREKGVWLHLDAAYGGLWRVMPSMRTVVPDLRLGDSMVVNPHKTLFASLESSCLYCREPGALERSFRSVPDYLRPGGSDTERDYMNQSLQLGRSFGALKLWWIIRSYGLEGIRRHYQQLLDSARWLEERLDSSDSFWRPAQSPFPLITLRCGDGSSDPAAIALASRRTQELLRLVNQSGRAYVSHANLRDGYTMRVSLGNIRTTREDVEEFWRLLQLLG
jgi:aromatic-L-amino-acid decarboxylase